MTNQDSLTVTEPLPGEVAREKARTALSAARYVTKKAAADLDDAMLHGAVEQLEVLKVLRALDMLDKVKIK